MPRMLAGVQPLLRPVPLHAALNAGLYLDLAARRHALCCVSLPPGSSPRTATAGPSIAAITLRANSFFLPSHSFFPACALASAGLAAAAAGTCRAQRAGAAGKPCRHSAVCCFLLLCVALSEEQARMILLRSATLSLCVARLSGWTAGRTGRTVGECRRSTVGCFAVGGRRRCSACVLLWRVVHRQLALHSRAGSQSRGPLD